MGGGGGCGCDLPTETIIGFNNNVLVFDLKAWSYTRLHRYTIHPSTLQSTLFSHSFDSKGRPACRFHHVDRHIKLKLHSSYLIATEDSTMYHRIRNHIRNPPRFESCYVLARLLGFPTTAQYGFVFDDTWYYLP